MKDEELDDFDALLVLFLLSLNAILNGSGIVLRKVTLLLLLSLRGGCGWSMSRSCRRRRHRARRCRCCSSSYSRSTC